MSIHERRENGKLVGYFAQINVKDYSGAWKSKRKNARTRTEAKAFEAELIGKRQRLELDIQKPPVDSSATLTVSGYLDRWLNGRQGLEVSTARRYKSSLAPVKDQAGQTPLTELTTLQLKAIYDSITAPRKDAKGHTTPGNSAKTALNTHRVVRKALQDAVDVYGELVRNPAIPQIAPSAKKFEAYRLTAPELNRILDAADETDYGSMCRLASWTGLRLGEILGLTWSALDIERGRLTVRQTVNTTGRVGDPKNDGSRRTIGLSPETVTLLRDVHRQQAEEKLRAGGAYKDKGYVFANALGWHRQQWDVSHVWRRIVTSDKVKLPAVRFHDLRHAHAAHLLSNGWDVTLVAERLGHQQPTTTLNMYAYAIPGRGDEMSKDIDRIFASVT